MFFFSKISKRQLYAYLSSSAFKKKNQMFYFNQILIILSVITYTEYPKYTQNLI